MIISASRRTDIPRYYAKWFIRRVRAGHCTVPNPFNPGQVRRVDLRPEAVTALVFWTRFPKLLMPYIPELEHRKLKFYFQYTITRYPDRYEPGAPPAEEAIACFRSLARLLGPGRMIWRYDPIFFTDECDPDDHLQNFARLCAQLQGCTRKVVISFLDEYRRTRSRMRAAGVAYPGDPLQHPGLKPLLQAMVEIAAHHHLGIESCAEPEWLQSYGIATGRCIDERLLQSEFGLRVAYKKDPGQRPLCGCMPSRDIGSNNTCPAGCLYCYATPNPAQAQERFCRHDVKAESLI